MIFLSIIYLTLNNILIWKNPSNHIFIYNLLIWTWKTCTLRYWRKLKLKLLFGSTEWIWDMGGCLDPPTEYEIYMGEISKPWWLHHLPLIRIVACHQICWDMTNDKYSLQKNWSIGKFWRVPCHWLGFVTQNHEFAPILIYLFGKCKHFDMSFI